MRVKSRKPLAENFITSFWVASSTPVTVPTADPTLRFNAKYGAEFGFDYGYVMISTDGGVTYTAIPGDHTVDAPLGPGLVTGWDFHGKRLRTYVNGRLAQDGSTDEMQWDMHYLVADVARTITLYPGDVLLSGTPANSRPVQPGDVVLLSPGGTSYDQYQDFEERGDHFAAVVRATENGRDA